MRVKLKKGSGVINFSIPDNMIIDTLTGKDIPALSHGQIKTKIAEGIKESAPLNIKNKKIVIIVPDNTRLWARGDIFVPVIVKTLQDSGVDASRIQIIIALGTHAEFDSENFASLVGDYGTNKIKILNSANKNYDRLVYLGTTEKKTKLYITKEACEADHIIIFGGVLHHLIAGFGGGRKYLLPGIAGYDSIQQNHSLAILKTGRPHPMVKQAQLLNNPVSEDMEDAASMFLKNKTCSYVAVAANGAGDIFHAGVGQLNETFNKGCDKLNNACCEKISQKGDFALISAGGHRTDAQLYQASKALFNAVNAVKEKGKILFVVGVEEGVGNKIFEKVLKEYKNRSEKIGAKLVKQFDMPSYIAFRVIDVLKRFDVTLISNLSKQETLKLGFKYSDDIDKYIKKSLSGKGYIIPFAENILPVMDNL
jgi:nickel-dependent lactate racemase